MLVVFVVLQFFAGLFGSELAWNEVVLWLESVNYTVPELVEYAHNMAPLPTSMPVVELPEGYRVRRLDAELSPRQVTWHYKWARGAPEATGDAVHVELVVPDQSWWGGRDDPNDGPELLRAQLYHHGTLIPPEVHRAAVLDGRDVSKIVVFLGGSLAENGGAARDAPLRNSLVVLLGLAVPRLGYPLTGAPLVVPRWRLVTTLRWTITTHAKSDSFQLHHDAIVGCSLRDAAPWCVTDGDGALSRGQDMVGAIDIRRVARPVDVGTFRVRYRAPDASCHLRSCMTSDTRTTALLDAVRSGLPTTEYIGAAWYCTRHVRQCPD